MASNRRPRIAFIDIETCPNLSYVWGRWQQDVIDVHTEWFMLSFALNWMGQKRVTTHALPDYPRYKKDKQDDSCLVREFWRVLDEADIVIAHNGDRFDIKKGKTRFLQLGLKPPAPFKTIDTLKIARKHFKFDSNRLDDLGRSLRIGRKLPNTGKHLWFGCMEGRPSAWRKMRRYNAQDVRLLMRVYEKLKAWDTSHPNLNLYSGNNDCPTCQSRLTKRDGFNYGKSQVRQRWRCTDCGARWSGALVK